MGAGHRAGEGVGAEHRLSGLQYAWKLGLQYVRKAGQGLENAATVPGDPIEKHLPHHR